MPNTAEQPDWRELYEAAILESDPAKVNDRIQAAVSAIVDRLQNASGIDLLFETAAARRALKVLRELELQLYPHELPKAG